MPAEVNTHRSDAGSVYRFAAVQAPAADCLLGFVHVQLAVVDQQADQAAAVAAAVAAVAAAAVVAAAAAAAAAAEAAAAADQLAADDYCAPIPA